MLIIGMNESLGIPFYYRKTRKTFHDHILEELRDTLKEDYLNMFSMLFNKTWNIEQIIKHNLTFEEIKKLKKYGNDLSRNNIVTKIGIPYHLRETDKIEENDNRKISDTLKNSDKVVILYASGVNNVMYKIHACFYDGVFNKEKKINGLNKLNDELIKEVMGEIESNFKMFYGLNKNTLIFVPSFSLELYTPNFILEKSKKFDGMDIVYDFVKKFNEKLEELCNKYDVFYIENQKKTNLKKEIVNIKNYILNNVNNDINIKEEPFIYDNLGLKGFLEDNIKILEKYKNEKQDSKINEELIKEHLSEIEMIKKAMN